MAPVTTPAASAVPTGRSARRHPAALAGPPRCRRV